MEPPRHHRPRDLAAHGRRGLPRPGDARGVRRRRRRLPLRRDRHGGALAAARARPHDRRAHVDLPAVHPRLRDAGAEAALPAAGDPRRDARRHLHDGAGHRLRPGERPDARRPRRRPLGRERRQDVHLARPARRPVHRRRADRPDGEAGAPGHQPDPRRGGHAGLRPRAKAREARPPGAGHERDLPPGLPRPGREPPRRRGRRLQDADGEAAAGAHLHRRHVDRVLPARARRHDRRT